MNDQKHRGADFGKRKHFTFFMAGLGISLLLAVLAFSWTVTDKAKILDFAEKQFDDPFINRIKIHNEPRDKKPPIPLKVDAPIKDIEIVKDIEKFLEPTTEVPKDPEFLKGLPNTTRTRVPEKTTDLPNMEDWVDEEATFTGGNFVNYLRDKVEYPAFAAELGIKGQVDFLVIIDEEGNVDKVKFSSSVDPWFKDEIETVVKNAPRWNPKKEFGVPQRSFKEYSINFILQK